MLFKRWLEFIARNIVEKLLKLFREYVLNPLSYSISGMNFMRHERAFRVELFCVVVSYPFCFWIFGFTWKLLVLNICYFLLLITECLNTAIEATVDLFTQEHHKLAKKAKDIASASVYLCLSNIVIIGLMLLFL